MADKDKVALAMRMAALLEYEAEGHGKTDYKHKAAAVLRELATAFEASKQEAQAEPLTHVIGIDPETGKDKIVRLKVRLYTAPPATPAQEAQGGPVPKNYTPLYEFALKNKVSYNELCAAVVESNREAKS